MVRVCPNCDGVFVPKNKNQVCCSKRCSYLHRPKTVCPKHKVERNQWYRCAQCHKESGCSQRSNSSEAAKRAVKKYTASEKGKDTLRRYSASAKGKEVRRKVAQKRNATPEGRLKRQAHNAVYRAIHNGKLIKLPCQVCGNPKAEAHHCLDYSKEHRLDVVFLCKTHHALADTDPIFNETLKSH